ncbi:MAG: beta-ketoacyl-ACP synthase II [Phycisphaerae bacterium]|nr:beta-ketoacyl-ACP synthase II [Gemmatimonadaceae bacterium]
MTATNSRALPPRRRVVVTGLGAVTPLGLTVPLFWTNAINGVSGAAPITRFDASAFSTKFACEVKGFDAHNYMDRKAAKRMDPFAHFALAAANEAIADAGLDTGTLSDAVRARIGVMIGSGQGGMQTFEAQAEVLRTSGPSRISPFLVPMMIVDSAGAVVAMQHGLRGPNHSVVSACATGNDNLLSALDAIRVGRADIIIAGGAEAVITPLGVGGFAAARALSTNNDNPEAASRPFDVARDGFVAGEGAAVLVLESLESAERRGARIYAELLGVGAACDAYHMTAPHPEGIGARLAMQAALEESGLTINDVDSINMHATSTPIGDTAECFAVRAVFGDAADRISITSTKSMTGHMLGAAGAAEAVLSVLSIVHGIVPPTINLTELDPACALTVVANTAQQREVRVALSNAFGFGGHNTAAIFSAPHIAANLT